MFDPGSLIVGLEIGTSKVCAVVGEVNSTGALNLIGVGQARSRGVRKGEIADAPLVEEDVRNAIVEAEQMADVEIRSVYLGVTGSHIRGFNNRGVHPVVSADREITEEDVQDVIKNAKAINLPAQNHVLHAIRQHFTVDGQDGIVNPTGMLGARVEVDVHVVHGNFNRLQNPIRTVKGLQLEVEAIVFNGLASSLALLTTEQKEMGALVIDIGGGTTNFAVYADGIIKHTGVLAVGGDHVSNDLAYGLKVPLGRAEQLKIERGSATADDNIKGQSFSISSELGLPEKSINLEHLRRIMTLRLEEIFQLIEQDIAQSGLLDYLRAGVFICGGGARIPDILKLAERVFQLPASLGKANSISGIKSALDQPEFATAIGLVKFGSFQQKKRRTGITEGIRQTFTDIFNRKS
ncbi:cell division protein FtsA [Pedosphaera parvula]|uniref:Cell division protein FtsA n=1 Tax=Pedosphaera parvula (strain Ellin514) TaxID=320771 RepID=B9XIG2_PEDPL|nr:cell division protein FtsA [Pedosphaera parvula]EEF60423.1 cell division protein FtsA [Pedosphaera parvula Ellin514]CAP18802.1 putative cell division protein FtsA [Pedosphaera parvula Ellin514]